MWKYFLASLLVLPLVACQPYKSDGFPPFLQDGHERTGPSSCTWHPRSIKLPDIGTLSFTYENCNPEDIRDSSYYADGNWVYFDYYEDSPRYDRYPVMGIFPLKGRDAETVLREEVFAEELKNPLCSLADTTRDTFKRRNQDPPPVSYPYRWHLNSTDEIWDGRGNTSDQKLQDVCGPFARNNVSPYSNHEGGYISEKYDHIFVLRRNENTFEIDLYTIRFVPVE